MKADPIPALRMAACHRPGGKFEHALRPAQDPGGAPGREILVRSLHLSFGVQEEHIDRMAHPEGVDRAAGLNPKAFTLAEGRAEKEPPKPGSKASRLADARSEDPARCLIFCSEHETILP